MLLPVLIVPLYVFIIKTRYELLMLILSKCLNQNFLQTILTLFSMDINVFSFNSNYIISSLRKQYSVLADKLSITNVILGLKVSLKGYFISHLFCNIFFPCN
jgi:hypothetical protein